jgi:hypothetical protein
MAFFLWGQSVVARVLRRLDEGTISTSELNVLRQFLKDNQISAQPAEGTPFGDLAKALPDIENVVSFKRRVS